MRNKLPYLFLFASGIVLWSACSQKTMSIDVLCEKGSKGDYEIKWELYPEPENAIVEIFSSDNDSTFFSTPTVIAKSDDYIAAMNLPDSARRQFFKLRIDKIWSGVISNRFFNLDSVHNFRDLGGYYTSNGQQVRWGKIFRSGNFRHMTANDRDEINRLHIKTHIDIRVQEVRPLNNPLNVEHYYRLPIGQDNFTSIVPQIREGRFMRGDAVIYTQDLYKEFVDNYTEQFAAFFDYLCHEDNYPILFGCHLGKEQAGLASYFLLYTLGVPVETIEDDYLASNRGINKSSLVPDITNLPESSQEALLLISNTDISYLRFALSCIRKKRGTLDEYLEKDLKITPEKQIRLRKILLYNTVED
ncbi:tyrosine-protein phosphatase [Dysgonomonas sp. 25]|uniref:tyrosine-protein phosphatase n=1 Tax=Dysgonomonas sp. 25 TaxID=2302933 RepID=UPI0013D03844|nr:tyrosine-protein phosphatase [Dysgonomonas sp. 25]NDV69401.1 tyrosine-protein phosphatase [Dysgonomonas sp. 25]